MRIRCIKPEFWQSESLSRVSREARLLFVGLFSACDDSGRTRAASRFLASLLFPYDEDVPKRIEGWLKQLEREGCVVRYEVDGNSYLAIPKWLDHQKIDRASASKFPPPPNPREPSTSPRESSSQDQGSGIRDQGSGIRNQGSKEEEREAGELLSVEPTKSPELGWSVAGGWTGLTDELRQRWSVAYPACNIDRQLAQMDTWLRANPKEAKKNNWQRFAANWLKREQDKGGDVRADRRNGTPLQAASADIPTRVGFTR